MIPKQHHKRLCDYCNHTTALLLCRADSAKLCLSCDREVHSTNQLFSKHTRSLLCDSCDTSPASIFCQTEHSVFCQNCDWERHNLSSLSSTHDRRPIEGFSGCPSVTELMAVLGFEDLGHKKSVFSTEESDGFVRSGLDDGYSDFFVWDSPSFVSIDDLIVSSDSSPNFQVMEVPPLPKNRNATCGQHKEELVCQLHELARSEPDSYRNADNDPIVSLQSLEADLQPTNINASGEHGTVPSFKENQFDLLTDNGEAPNQVFVPSPLPGTNFDCSVPDKDFNFVGGTIHINDDHEAEPQPLATAVLPNTVVHELNSQERDSALSRYKEKKKTRRYDKHIRYESRKVRAESRTRIKGRFAKVEH